MRIIHGEASLESVLADSLSFQRPTIISENFRTLDLKIDIATWLKKPYHKRKKSLFDSITDVVEIRDIIVHTGMTDINIFDQQIKAIMDDLIVAVDRVYRGFGDIFSFKPSFDF